MNWEEAVIHFRKDPTQQQMISTAYLDADLKKNAQRFYESEEFEETLKLLRSHTPSSDLKLLDIGSGNGISCISFARKGFDVTAVEPDPSATVGRAAITELQKEFSLQNLKVVEAFAEELPFPDASFDVVYTRQCMHHAHDLTRFVAEAARVLRPGGIFFSTRDHVINDAVQMNTFLEEHPLHKFYGGENAFTLDQYKSAIAAAGLQIKTTLGPLDSVINIAPKTKKELAEELRAALIKKIKFLPLSDAQVLKLVKLRTHNLKNNAGRLYSFICKK